MGKSGKASRKRRHAARSAERRATYAYEKGFEDGFLAAKQRFFDQGWHTVYDHHAVLGSRKKRAIRR